MSTPADSPEDCIFCRIVKGDLPGERVFEDADVLAFLDISPVAPGHTLIIPKQHYATALDLPGALGTPVMQAISLVGKALASAVGAAGFNCLQNNFAAAGQVVRHIHWHVIPRFPGDGLALWPHAPYPHEGDIRRVAEALRAGVSDARER